ncbi:MAG: tripartite tricarboxylate transporter substrate binding protein [Rhizobiales bacterium]|nr:tripartite tricarboxylate transporter substrate binding protein [Hyphomicrobiales bacterium]
MTLRQALAATAIAAVVFVTPHAQAQDPSKDYPSKNITLVVPFPPGGGNDAMARIMADRLSVRLGKTVVVENRGGGGGIIGTRSAAKAAPDGYTLMLGHTGSIGINPTLYANSDIDPRKDFTAVGLIATMPLVLLTHPSVKAKTIGELIALAKKQPGKVNLGSSSKGTGSHMCAEMFMAEAQVDMNLIPYKGTAQLVTDLVGGHVQVSFGVIPPAYGNIKSGNLRAIAVTSPKRTALLPEVPTATESGLPGFEVVLNYGLLAPAGTPKPIVDKINQAMRVAIENEEVRKRISADGAEAVASTPSEYAAIVDRDETRWSALIKKLNLKVE